MRLDMRSDSIDVIELLLAQWAGEVLGGVDSRVVDELVLGLERFRALLAAVDLCVGLGLRAPGLPARCTVLQTEMPGN